MKKYILALFVLALMFSLSAQADELVCGENQTKKSVLVSEAVPGTDAVTHVVHHESVTHEITVVDTPASTYYKYVGLGHGDYLKIGHHYIKTIFGHGDYDLVTVPAVTHQETIIDSEAWDETVIDVPATDGQPAVYQEVCEDVVVVPPTVTPTATPEVSRSGGYMSPCEYIKVFSDMPCTWSPELATKFGLDDNFRESILKPWRLVIFGGK